MASTQKTRDHILKSSLAVFLANGYNGTGMSLLVKEAGLSKGAFYHYYNSKQELYEDALNNFFKGFIEGQQHELMPSKPFRQSIKDLYGTIPKLVDEMVQMTGNKNLAPNYYKILVDFNSRNQVFHRTLNEYYRKTHLYLVRLITKAKENREIKFEPNAEVLATQIICLMEGVGFVASIRNPDEIKAEYDRVFDQFFRLVEV